MWYGHVTMLQMYGIIHVEEGWHSINSSDGLHVHVQVRISVNRNQDLRMNAGRATIDLEYDVGFDDSGKIQVGSLCTALACCCQCCCAANVAVQRVAFAVYDECTSWLFPALVQMAQPATWAGQAHSQPRA